MTTHFHVIHTALDDRIPFCEYFIVPYLLWFGYVAWAVGYFYFKNKDDLLIHVIDYHTNNIIRFFDRTVNDLSIPKFKVFFHNFFSNVELNSYHGGSPLGNIANELSDVNEDIRQHLLLSYRKIEMKFSFFLSMMKNINPNYKTLQAEEVARVLVSQMEGTMLKIKLEKKENAITDFFFIFDKLLKANAG